MNSFIGIRVGQRISAGEAYPAVINDGNSVAWYIASELSTITKDGSNRVSRWNDFLGSGHDLLQANALGYPLWVNPDYISFDTLNKSLQTVAFTFNQPCYCYLVVKQDTWSASVYLMTGSSINTYLQQRTSTPNIRMSAGTPSVLNANLAVGSWGIVRVFYNGAASKLQVNQTVATTGNFGANAMGGIGIPYFIYAGLSAVCSYKEALFRSSINGEDDIYDYLSAKYSI